MITPSRKNECPVVNSNPGRRLLLWLAILFLGIFIYQVQENSKAFLTSPKRSDFLPADINTLRLGDQSNLSGPVEITVNEPVELDGISREELFRLRGDLVMNYSDLIVGNYHPSQAPFGQIVSGKPWWGLMGISCRGPGEQGIEGPSEESRYLLNPFLLLGVDEQLAWPTKGDCFTVYPHLLSLTFDAQNKTATAVYDIKRLFKEWKEVPRLFGPGFHLVNYNARDFGYNYVAIDRKRVMNVQPEGKARIFHEPIYLAGFIHLGGSCGYPGGCNNGSPTQTDLFFDIKELPAEATCKLWKNKPANINQPADFIFVIKFE